MNNKPQKPRKWLDSQDIMALGLAAVYVMLFFFWEEESAPQERRRLPRER